MTKNSTGYELILNACESVLQIGITNNAQPVCFEEWYMPHKATEILADSLREICQRLNIKINEFRRIVCTNGPGSFTGIRLVLTTAAALRRATHAKLAAIDYMQALAMSAAIQTASHYMSKIFVITHARRNLVHFQSFTSCNPLIPPLADAPVKLITPEKTTEYISASSCFVCGSALEKYPDYFGLEHIRNDPHISHEYVLLHNLVNPSFTALRFMALHGKYFDKDIEPQYIRHCDAENNIEQIAEKQNLDAEEIRQSLNLLLSRNPSENI